MKISPLQYLLATQAEPNERVLQVVGVDRSQLWRWKHGEAMPRRKQAERLIALYGPQRLDFNGCYIASVEITDEQARGFGLIRAA